MNDMRKLMETLRQIEEGSYRKKDLRRKAAGLNENDENDEDDGEFTVDCPRCDAGGCPACDWTGQSEVVQGPPFPRTRQEGLDSGDGGVAIGQWLKTMNKLHGGGRNNLNYDEFAQSVAYVAKKIRVDVNQLKFEIDRNNGATITISEWPSEAHAKIFDEYWSGGDWNDEEGYSTPTPNQVKYFGYAQDDEVVTSGSGPDDHGAQGTTWSGRWD